MKKSLIAAALILCTPQSALAQEEFYVLRDRSTSACRVVNGSELTKTHNVNYVQLGKYATMNDAKAALDSTLGQDCLKFYVLRDNTTNACRVVSGSELAGTQKVRYTQLGKYATKDDAKAARDSMLGNKCPK
jgi:hypothetical protein